MCLWEERGVGTGGDQDVSLSRPAGAPIPETTRDYPRLPEIAGAAHTPSSAAHARGRGAPPPLDLSPTSPRPSPRPHAGANPCTRRTAAAAAAAVPFEPTARGCTPPPPPRPAHEQRLRGCWSRGRVRSQGASSAARCSLRPPRRAAGHSCGRLRTRIRLDVGETRWPPARKVPRRRSAAVWFATSRSDPNRSPAAAEVTIVLTIALPPTGVGPHSWTFCSRIALRHPKRVIAPCRGLDGCVASPPLCLRGVARQKVPLSETRRAKRRDQPKPRLHHHCSCRRRRRRRRRRRGAARGTVGRCKDGLVAALGPHVLAGPALACPRSQLDHAAVRGDGGGDLRSNRQPSATRAHSALLELYRERACAAE